MKDVKKLTNKELLVEVQSLVGQEKRILVQVLKYLREIESRKLFLERGYSSLFAFCVEYLGYEESQAYRRITAARLVREIPEIEVKVEGGCLSLTALTQAQSFFRRQALNGATMDTEQKKEVLGLLENKSTRECEKELIKLCPELIIDKTERVRLLSEDLSEVRLVLKTETLEKLKKLRNIFSNRNQNMGLSDVIDILAADGLMKFDLSKKSFTKKRPFHRPLSAPKVKKENTNRGVEVADINKSKQKSARPRSVPASLRKKVWARDMGKCTFMDALTGKKCESQFRIHIDHIKPWAMGGESTMKNLRLLCAQHNNLQALHLFGKKKMAQYVGGRR
jgi:5-methylcytosine-specific restriction endonuclease McrA